jgi:hypothetical protein
MSYRSNIALYEYIFLLVSQARDYQNQNLCITFLKRFVDAHSSFYLFLIYKILKYLHNMAVCFGVLYKSISRNLFNL